MSGLVMAPSSGNSTIPEYTTDPVSPVAEDAWILRTEVTDGVVGVPRGLLLALTYTGLAVSSTYQFSYRTSGGTTIRTALI